MDEYTVTLMDDGRVVVPAEMRRRLGLRSGDKLIFTIVGNEIRVQCPRIALEAVLGSIEPLPGTTTDDIERQIDQASEAAARRRYARMVSHPSSPD